jgi:hypothetical protein
LVGYLIIHHHLEKFVRVWKPRDGQTISGLVVLAERMRKILVRLAPGRSGKSFRTLKDALPLHNERSSPTDTGQRACHGSRTSSPWLFGGG